MFDDGCFQIREKTFVGCPRTTGAVNAPRPGLETRSGVKENTEARQRVLSRQEKLSKKAPFAVAMALD
jgi:hypothetical protein